jgi:hypothetical protein
MKSDENNFSRNSLICLLPSSLPQLFSRRARADQSQFIVLFPVHCMPLELNPPYALLFRNIPANAKKIGLPTVSIALTMKSMWKPSPSLRPPQSTNPAPIGRTLGRYRFLADWDVRLGIVLA